MPEATVEAGSLKTPNSSSATGTNPAKQLEVLFLYTHPLPEVGTIIDHVEALTTGSRHRVHRINMIGELPPRLDLDRFDVIIIHYGIIISMANHLCAESFARIKAASPMKAVFIQDEYRHVNATVQAVQDLYINVLFTCIPVTEFEKVYPEEKLPGVRKVNVLTGYVPSRMLQSSSPKPLKDRQIDVGYRARVLPAWLGRLGREKWLIGERFKEDAKAYKLRCDISVHEADRLYGDDWDSFLVNCKAMLGVESGASVFDFTGEIQTKVSAAESAEPEVAYEELEKRFFPSLDGLIRLNQISPRCFEAAARGTLMILYEGEYSGRLKPGRHYVELKKNHSNVADVIAILQDEKQAQAIVDRAWKEVACAPENSYETFTDSIDTIIYEEWEKHPKRTVASYSDQEFIRDSARSLKAKLIFLKCYLGWRIPLLRRAAQLLRDYRN